jgi:hypothetical protein
VAITLLALLSASWGSIPLHHTRFLLDDALRTPLVAAPKIGPPGTKDREANLQSWGKLLGSAVIFNNVRLLGS